MMLSVVLAAAEPRTAVEAERAFAADAQAMGQWSAFRKWAADDATMFVPQPVKAQAWLRSRAEPARAVAWQPAESFASCDGKVAVNTGPWQRPNGSVGYFTTVWVRQADGRWRWVMDGGDRLYAPHWPASVRPNVRRAACHASREFLVEVDPQGGQTGSGSSPDGTLRWFWCVRPSGERDFTASISTGARVNNRRMVVNHIAAPAR